MNPDIDIVPIFCPMCGKQTKAIRTVEDGAFVYACTALGCLHEWCEAE